MIKKKINSSITKPNIHFIANFASNDDLDSLRRLSWDEGTTACVTHTWVWPLYCRMKMRGLNVSIGYAPEPDAINLIHGEVARALFKASDFRKYFIIGIRADFRPFPYGQFEIVQNMHTAKGSRIYIPLYSQPGLLPRERGRSNVVNICFVGEVQNAVAMENLANDVKKIGCRFVHKSMGEWHDLRDVDILLGIRSFSKDPHHSKPPTKLFNAWLAGIPFIGGYDSAFEQVGTPGEDYLRVSTYDELLDAIKKIRCDNELYEKLVKNGLRAVASYTPEKITNTWLEVFAERIIPAYMKWIEQTSFIHRFDDLVKGEWFLVREMLIAQMLRRLSLR